MIKPIQFDTEKNL